MARDLEKITEKTFLSVPVLGKIWKSLAYKSVGCLQNNDQLFIPRMWYRVLGGKTLILDINDKPVYGGPLELDVVDFMGLGQERILYFSGKKHDLEHILFERDQYFVGKQRDGRLAIYGREEGRLVVPFSGEIVYRGDYPRIPRIISAKKGFHVVAKSDDCLMLVGKDGVRQLPENVVDVLNKDKRYPRGRDEMMAYSIYGSDTYVLWGEEFIPVRLDDGCDALICEDNSIQATFMDDFIGALEIDGQAWYCVRNREYKRYGLIGKKDGKRVLFADRYFAGIARFIFDPQGKPYVLGTETQPNTSFSDEDSVHRAEMGFFAEDGSLFGGKIMRYIPRLPSDPAGRPCGRANLGIVEFETEDRIRLEFDDSFMLHFNWYLTKDGKSWGRQRKMNRSYELDDSTYWNRCKNLAKSYLGDYKPEIPWRNLKK